MLSQFNNIVMATELNSVHKHSESPPHCGGRESETIADYLCCGSHDLRNSGYRCRGSLRNGQNYIIQLFLQFGGVHRGGKPKPPIISLNSAGRVRLLHSRRRWFESNSENYTGVMESAYILSSKLRFCEFKSRLQYLSIKE